MSSFIICIGLMACQDLRIAECIVALGDRVPPREGERNKLLLRIDGSPPYTIVEPLYRIDGRVLKMIEDEAARFFHDGQPYQMSPQYIESWNDHCGGAGRLSS
jgi:hypothetical protein